MPLAKRKTQLLVLGGLALASYDVKAEGTTLDSCMQQCTQILTSTAAACRGAAAKVECTWTAVPANCVIKVSCG